MKSFWLSIVILLLVSPVYALERFEIVTTEELVSLLAEREAGKIRFHLVNTLDRMIADHHSIPGSINIPWSEVDKRKGLLGEDYSFPIITYCMGYR